MPVPRQATFDQSVTVTWSNGDAFDGFILVGIVSPVSGTPWAQVDVANFYPRQRVPVFTRVPIKGGKFHNFAGLLFTADLDPPNVRYVCWYYDFTGRQIAGPSSQFAVTASPVTPPLLTLTVPSVGSTNPTPDT